jgi:hypothetical protein
MNILPNEIRLDIAEYVLIPRREGRMNDLDLSNTEIIERIQLYDPSFSFNTWKKQLQEKRDLYEKYSNTPGYHLMELVYQYETETGTHPYIRFTRQQHKYKSSSLPLLEEEIKKEFSLRDDEIYGSFIDNTPVITIIDPDDRFHDRDIALVMIDPYTDTITNIHIPGTSYLAKYAEIASTIDTLEEYLHHVIIRANEDIFSRDLYPFYEYISSMKFHLKYVDASDTDDYIDLTIIGDNPPSVEMIKAYLSENIRQSVTMMSSQYDDSTTNIFIYSAMIADMYDELFSIHVYLHPIKYQ